MATQWKHSETTTTFHSPTCGRVGLSGPERALPGGYRVRPSRTREGEFDLANDEVISRQLLNHYFRFVFVLAGLFFVGCQKTPLPPAPASSTKTGTVTVEIKTVDHLETFLVHDVAGGTTLESMMRSMDQVPITIHGSGLTAFVDGIGGQSTSSGMGWTFKVDGEFANQGIGSTTLAPPTTITWSYGDASEIMDQ